MLKKTLIHLKYVFLTQPVELAGEINTNIPYYVVQKKILILGVAYKRDIDDMRESPSLKLIELLKSKGTVVDYNDSYIPEIPVTRHYKFEGMKSVPLNEHTVSNYDTIIIATNHSVYDYTWLYSKANLIIDTRNVVGVPVNDDKVVKA